MGWGAHSHTHSSLLLPVVMRSGCCCLDAPRGQSWFMHPSLFQLYQLMATKGDFTQNNVSEIIAPGHSSQIPTHNQRPNVPVND